MAATERRGSLRLTLALSRLEEICGEDHVPEPWGAQFRKGAGFLLGKEEEVPDGENMFGAFMAFLPFGRRALWDKKETGTAMLETFIGFYNFFERGVPDEAAQRAFLYWPVFDYAEKYLPDRIGEMLLPLETASVGTQDDAAEEMVFRYRENHPDKKGIILSGRDDAFSRNVIRAAREAGLFVCAPQKNPCPLLGLPGMPGLGRSLPVNEDLRFLMDARMKSRMADVCAEALRGRKSPVGTLYVGERPAFPVAPELKSLWEREKKVFSDYKIDL